MFAKLFRFLRKTKIIKVQSIEFPDLPEFLVSNSTLQALSKHETIIETPSDFSLITEDAIYRAIKPKGKPQIIRIRSLQVHPDQNLKANLDKATLLKFALAKHLLVFETENGELVIPMPGLVFIAKKGEG